MKPCWLLACVVFLGCSRQPTIVGTWVNDPNTPTTTAKFTNDGICSIKIGSSPEIQERYSTNGKALTRSSLGGSKLPAEILTYDIHDDRLTVDAPKRFPSLAVLHRRKSN
jgi:hypothetical protein